MTIEEQFEHVVSLNFPKAVLQLLQHPIMSNKTKAERIKIVNVFFQKAMLERHFEICSLLLEYSPEFLETVVTESDNLIDVCDSYERNIFLLLTYYEQLRSGDIKVLFLQIDIQKIYLVLYAQKLHAEFMKINKRNIALFKPSDEVAGKLESVKALISFLRDRATDNKYQLDKYQQQFAEYREHYRNDKELRGIVENLLYCWDLIDKSTSHYFRNLLSEELEIELAPLVRK